MEEVEQTQAREVSAKQAAKSIRRFIKSRPEAQDADGMFTLKASKSVQGAGTLGSNKLIQLQFVEFALSSAAAKPSE